MVEASLPGIKPSEIQVTVTENVLNIRASREQEEKAEKDGSSYERRERYVGELSRCIGLPGPVDASRVSAVYEHGVLTVTVPKTTQIKPAEITIQVKAANEPEDLPKAQKSRMSVRLVCRSKAVWALAVRASCGDRQTNLYHSREVLEGTPWIPIQTGRTSTTRLRSSPYNSGM